MAKVTADTFASEIEKILQDYVLTTEQTVEETTKAVAQKGVQLLKSEIGTKFKGTGEYKKGWRVDLNLNRTHSTATIYNSRLPGLPHLLEHGHAKRGGGRVAGRAHISPVEKIINETYQKTLERKL